LAAYKIEYRLLMRDALVDLLTSRKQLSLYVAAGILPATGFFSETARRISRSLLPDEIDTSQLKDVLAAIFHRPDDEIWVNGIDDSVWLDLLGTIFEGNGDAPDAPGQPLPVALEQLLESLRVLSYHVAGIGLDPELVRVLASLEEHDSPFIAQNVEMLAYLQRFTGWWSDPAQPLEDDRHLLVLLDQCRDIMQRIRRRAAQEGTSISLTFKMERLRQNLKRIEQLLHLVEQLRQDRRLPALLPAVVPLFKRLVYAECRKNDLGPYWKRNIELLSLRITENAGRTGEHYITSDRPEYFTLLRSALGAGIIIALMAGFKLVIAAQHLAPANEALAFCLNYGLGFVLIHMLHFTVATKQPAMTANALSASIEEASAGKQRDLHQLADLVARTTRSQLAAIIGNVTVAIPVAILVTLLVHVFGGGHFVPPEKAEKLLADVHPFASGSLFYAAVAGVCLFLSGLIAGYYDNLAAYNRIPQRLLQLRWPRRVFGDERMRGFADYIGNNLGALAGNFFFGFMLGGASALGVLFGLPIDIRHIAFSSAYLGYASASLDFVVDVQALAWAALGVAL
ncbi:MAG: site-specific recombinase, partial [Zoogloea sp.]|nr:site-specific recombinase [Zoogloea sp.]